MASDDDRTGKSKHRNAESSSSRQRSKRSRSQHSSIDKAISMELVCIKDEIVCIPSKFKRDEKHGRKRTASGKRGHSKREVEHVSHTYTDNSDSALSGNEDRRNLKAQKIQQLTKVSKGKKRKLEIELPNSCSCSSSDETDREDRSKDKGRKRRQAKPAEKPKENPKPTRKTKKKDSQLSVLTQDSKTSGNSSEVIFLKVYMPKDPNHKIMSCSRSERQEREKTTTQNNEDVVNSSTRENNSGRDISLGDQKKRKEEKKKKKPGIFACLRKSKKEK